MEKFLVNGGNRLTGEVTISGAKNAAVAIIPAALLVDGVCCIENMPQISDTDMLLTILKELGAKIRVINKSTVEIDCTDVHMGFGTLEFFFCHSLKNFFYLLIINVIS